MGAALPLHDLLQHHLLARRRRPRRQGAALPIRALLPVVPRARRAQPDGGLPRRRHARRLTIASGCLGMVLFIIFQIVRVFVVKRADESKTKKIKEEIAAKPEFAKIQSELYKNTRDAQP